MPSVSVLVPVRNEARSIESTLRSLLTQDYPRERFDVIVADGGSIDRTVPIVRKLQSEFSNLRLVFNPDRLSSAARNLAVRHMTGEIGVVVDGHCRVPDRNYLNHLVAAFEQSQADCLGRPQPLDGDQPTPFQRAVSLARASRLGHNPGSDIYSDQPKFVAPQSTAVAYRRDVFHRIGLFDQRFDACEDVEFNQRVHDAGMTCYFAPEAKIIYHPRGSWRSLFTQLARYGTGRARLARKNLKSLTIPAVMPAVAVIGLIVGLVMSLWLPGVATPLALIVIGYLALLTGAGLWLGRRESWAVRGRIPPAFLAIHFGFAYGFLREFRRRQSRS